MALTLLFAAVYYFARLGLFYAGVTGTVDFDVEVSSLTRDVVNYSCLAIGAFGFLFLLGIYLAKPWGFWGTIAVSLYTIAFDAWAVATIQPSAALGMIPGAVLIAYLLLTRRGYLGARPRTAGS